jgi:DNA-binding PadR family transcriptional regulator
MESPVTTRAAILQALREGPGYGLELIRRLESICGGRLRLSEGRVYSVLAGLEAEGLVRTSRVTPGGKRGARSRTYYDLTIAGVETSASERAILAALVMRRPLSRPSRRVLAAMVRRVAEGEEVADSGEEIRSAMSRIGPRA